MPNYTHHLFICENARDKSDPRGCCRAKGSEEIRAAFKAEIKARGLTGIVRANGAACLDTCAQGPSIVVYPEGIWYGGVTIDDVIEIIDSHIIGGKPVERLLIK